MGTGQYLDRGTGQYSCRESRSLNDEKIEPCKGLEGITHRGNSMCEGSGCGGMRDEPFTIPAQASLLVLSVPSHVLLPFMNSPLSDPHSSSPLLCLLLHPLKFSLDISSSRN